MSIVKLNVGVDIWSLIDSDVWPIYTWTAVQRAAALKYFGEFAREE